jgi:hypothetical protein
MKDLLIALAYAALVAFVIPALMHIYGRFA